MLRRAGPAWRRSGRRLTPAIAASHSRAGDRRGTHRARAGRVISGAPLAGPIARDLRAHRRLGRHRDRPDGAARRVARRGRRPRRTRATRRLEHAGPARPGRRGRSRNRLVARDAREPGHGKLGSHDDLAVDADSGRTAGSHRSARDARRSCTCRRLERLFSRAPFPRGVAPSDRRSRYCRSTQSTCFVCSVVPPPSRDPIRSRGPMNGCRGGSAHCGVRSHMQIEKSSAAQPCGQRAARRGGDAAIFSHASLTRAVGFSVAALSSRRTADARRRVLRTRG